MLRMVSLPVSRWQTLFVTLQKHQSNIHTYIMWLLVSFEEVRYAIFLNFYTNSPVILHRNKCDTINSYQQKLKMRNIPNNAIITFYL